MARPIRITIVVFLIASLLAAGYCAWALYLLDPGTMIRRIGAPLRDLPHPDYVIVWLNDWYDERFPVAPGHIKLHAEFPLVRATFQVLFGVFAGSTIIWFVLLVACTPIREREGRRVR